MSKRIGLFINGYDSTKVLEAGQSDVNRIFKAMINKEIGNCCETLSEKHLSVDSEEEFTSILNKLLKKLSPSDQFIFYFSGHGEIDGTQYYLKFGEESYFFETFHTILRGKRINNAIIIIDACFSGEVAKSNNKLILHENLPEGIAILTSSTEEEYSHENKSKTFSVFTELLCECIETGNKGEKTLNNLISIPDIIEYVAKNNDHYKQQTPKHKISNSSENIWISKNITKDSIKENTQKNQQIIEENRLSDIEVINYKNCTFTQKLNDVAMIDDLNWDLVEKYIYHNKIEIDSNQTKKNILKELGFMKHNKLINSVIINFSERPDRRIPQSFVVASLNKDHREDIYGPLSTLLNKSLTYVLSKLDTYSNFLVSGLREDDYVIPKIIVRELLSNALTHRCYDDQECNTPVKVIVSTHKEQLEITSPGNFLGSLENMLNNANNDFSYLRDAQMGDFATSLGVAEILGRGFDCIREYRHEFGNDFIQFLDEKTHLKIIIKFRPLTKKIVNLKDKVTIPLTKKLGMNSKFFQGRNNDMDEIDKVFLNSNLLLIHGIGGIGKSSLVSNYLSLNKEKYKYVGYIVVEDNIKSNFIAKLRDSLELKGNTVENTFNEAIEKLMKLEGDKLLVIDDLRYSEIIKDDFNSILDLKDYGYKIIFTSRMKISSIQNYPLGTLSSSVAQNLFLEYFQSDDIQSIQTILEFIDYHPLFIELITKTINSEGYSLEGIIEMFGNGKLSEIKFIDEENGYEANLNHMLKELFAMQKIEKPYELLLKKLSIFPSIEIDVSFLEKILEEVQLTGRLNFLVSRGWLIRHGTYYKLHQIIKEYILNNHLPKFTEIKNMILTYNSILEDNITEYKQDHSIYFNSIIRVLKQLNVKNELVIEFYNSIGDVYNYIGKYVQALESFELAYSIALEIFDEKQELSLMSCNNIALMHDKLGRNQKALQMYEKSLIILETNYIDNFTDIGVMYGNISNIYHKLNNLSSSISFQTKAIELLEKDQGKESLDLAICYNNLGMIYKTKKEFSKSLVYLNKSLNINKTLDNEHNQEIAIVYDNLAVVFIFMNQKEGALLNIKKSLEIKLSLFNENHPEVANTYYNISMIYMETKECHKANYYAQKSIDIFMLMNRYVHPNLKMAKIITREAMINIKKEKKAPFKKKGKYCIDSEDFDIEI